MEENTTQDFRFTLNWKQSSKGDWYVDKLGVKGNTAKEIEDAMNQLIEVRDRVTGKIKGGV